MTSGFPSELVTAVVLVVGAFLFYLVARALLAEIWPMIRLLFHRAPETAEDEHIELKQ